MSWPVVNTIPGRCASTVSSFWARLTIREISGSCGDLGVFIPLVVGMVKTNGLDLGTTLVFTGAYNVITGVAFGIPMPVQPMKTIAAVALSGDPLTVPQIMAAGMFVSISVLLLGATGLMGLAQRWVPGILPKIWNFIIRIHQDLVSYQQEDLDSYRGVPGVLAQWAAGREGGEVLGEEG